MMKHKKQTDDEKRREGDDRGRKGKSFEQKTTEIFQLKGFEVDRILKRSGVEGLSKNAAALYREIHGKPEYEIVYLKEFSDRQIREYLQKAMKESWQAAYDKNGPVFSVYLSGDSCGDNRLIISGSEDNTIKLWDIECRR